MNERIEKLWTKVCQSEMPELDETCMTLQRRTKFAESVVMECTKILADNSEFRSCVIIGKHFGVFGVEE